MERKLTLEEQIQGIINSLNGICDELASYKLSLEHQKKQLEVMKSEKVSCDSKKD